MIGAARDAGGGRAAPIVEEAEVEDVAALGRLDEGEGAAGGADDGPVDVALVFRDVDAVDVVMVRGVAGPVMRIVVAERCGAGDGAADLGARRGRGPAAGGDEDGGEKNEGAQDRTPLGRVCPPEVSLAAMPRSWKRHVARVAFSAWRPPRGRSAAE